jgi:hypothetical protein
MTAEALRDLYGAMETNGEWRLRRRGIVIRAFEFACDAKWDPRGFRYFCRSRAYSAAAAAGAGAAAVAGAFFGAAFFFTGFMTAFSFALAALRSR